MRVKPPSPRTLAALLATVAAALTLAMMGRSVSGGRPKDTSGLRRALAGASLAPKSAPPRHAKDVVGSEATATTAAGDEEGADRGRYGARTNGAVEAKSEIELLLLRLEDDPNDQEALDRLASLHLTAELRDEIFGAVSRLYHENPGSHVLAEALGTLCHQEERYEAAADHLRRAVDYTNRPMRVRTLLTYVELKSGDFMAARETARETRTLLNAYLSGKRDRTLIKEELKDDYMLVPCYFEAIAAAKSDDVDGAKRALATCGDGILSDDDRRRLIEDADVDAWHGMDIDDILD